MRVLTYVSILSVGMTLSSFVIVMAVMNGFDRDLQSRIVSSIGAIRGFPIAGVLAYTAELREDIQSVPGVLAVTPELELSALLRSPSSGRLHTAAVESQIIAVPLPQKSHTSSLDRHLTPGSRLPVGGDILLGESLADKLSVERGDSLQAIVLFPATHEAVTTRDRPVEAGFRVSGTYRTGYYEVDASRSILARSTIDPLFDLPPALAHSLEIAVDDPSAAPAIAARLDERVGARGLYFRSWRQMREPLFRAVNLEKRVMGMILSIFGFISVFCVLSALIATSIEKRRELAALRAMGMTRREQSVVLLVSGAIAAGLGIVLGTIMAGCGHQIITRSDLFRLPPEIYDLDRLPSAWSTPLFLASAAALFVLSVLASAIPAAIQSRNSPSEALREE